MNNAERFTEIDGIFHILPQKKRKRGVEGGDGRVVERATTTSPLYDTELIGKIKQYFLTRHYRVDKLRYRNYAFFVCGMYLMLREGDLLKLRVKHVVDMKPDGTYAFRSGFAMHMGKTDERIEIPFADSVKEAVSMMLDHEEVPVSPDRALFYNYLTGEPISPQEGRKIIRSALLAVGYKGGTGTHTLRKTGAWHLYQSLVSSGNADALRIVQQVLGHQDGRSTRFYLRITQEETNNAFLHMPKL